MTLPHGPTTMRTTFNDPRLRLPGIRGTLPRKTLPRTYARQSSSPMTPMFPTFTVEGAVLDVLKVPTGTADPADGRSATFLLRRLRIDRDLPEVTLVSVAAVLLPTDSLANGSTVYNVAGAVSLGWGDTTGVSAAIVVGKNLNAKDGVWFHIRSGLAGLETNPTASRDNSSPPKYLAVMTFPTGKLNDTTPNKTEPRWAFSPYTQRFSIGDTLDVMLLVRSTQIVNASGADRFICGYADIRLQLGLLHDSASFYE